MHCPNYCKNSSLSHVHTIIYRSQLELGAVQVEMTGYSLVVHAALAWPIALAYCSDIPNEKVHIQQGNDEPHTFCTPETKGYSSWLWLWFWSYQETKDQTTVYTTHSHHVHTIDIDDDEHTTGSAVETLCDKKETIVTSSLSPSPNSLFQPNSTLPPSLFPHSVSSPSI